MKKLFLFTAVAVLGLIACNKNEIVEPTSKMKAPKLEYDEKAAAEYNADFDKVALAVNRLLAENAEFKTIVKNEVGKQFDGDYDVLISQLVVNYQSVENWFKNYNADIRSIVEKYPLIQIAIPENYEQWDGKENLCVIYLPYKFQENTAEWIFGYNEFGVGTSFSVKDFFEKRPRVVISENERVTIVDDDDKEPPAPTNFRATTNPSGGIHLMWNKPVTTKTISGYTIYRKGAGDNNFVEIISIYGENDVAYVDKSVIPDNSYSYQVLSFYQENAGWVIERHNFFEITRVRLLTRYISDVVNLNDNCNPVIAPPLAAPQAVNLKHGNARKLLLEWNSVSSYASGYEIWRIAENENQYSLVGTTGYNGNNFINRNLTAGKFYRYEVRAITSGGGYSPWSNSIATFASDRNNSDRLAIKRMKFKNQSTRRNYEWGRGKPEFLIKLIKGDNVQSNIIYQTVYDCTTYLDGEWENLDIELLSGWNTEANGTIFTLYFAEKDGSAPDFDVTVSTNIENKLDSTGSGTIKPGASLSFKISDKDDEVGWRIFNWWDAISKEYFLGGDAFSWKFE